MAMSRRQLPYDLNSRSVLRGAAAYLAIAIPCGLIIGLVHGADSSGNESGLWVLAAVVVILVAPVVGGAVAANDEPHAPLSHAAAAVGLPATLFLLGRTIYGAANGTLTAADVVSFLLYLLVFIGLAIGGGYLAFRRAQSR
ncbi:MAG TPA: hypothetical protein VF942_04495 [Acidimicrobiales bacterium]